MPRYMHSIFGRFIAHAVYRTSSIYQNSSEKEQFYLGNSGELWEKKKLELAFALMFSIQIRQTATSQVQ